jgi:hypothetical protein
MDDMKNNLFVRYGGLSLKRQKGYGNDTYHAPPAKRGLYAMPYVLQERFLISSLYKTQSEIYPSDKDWSEASKEELREHLEKIETIKNSSFKKFRIPTDAEFWHHLVSEVDREEILQEHNDWVKTNFKAWETALKRAIMRLKCKEKCLHYYSLDRFEVFFDTSYF